MYKQELSEGTACIVVKFENDEEKKVLLDYLHNNGFKVILKGPIGFSSLCNWYWVNMNSNIYCIGKPGVQYAHPFGKHAVTVEEFKVINDIYKKYEGLSVLKMN